MGQTCCTGAVAVSPEFGGVVQPIAGLTSPFRDATLTGIVVQPTAGFIAFASRSTILHHLPTPTVRRLPALLFILFLPSLSHSPLPSLSQMRCSPPER